MVEAELELKSGQTINPLTRHSITQISFTVVGDRLLYLGPPEFVGAPPINLAFITADTRLEDLVVNTLNDHLYQLERRSKELTSIGIAPRVDPPTLQLSADLMVGGLQVTIGANRSGQFRVLKASYDGAEIANVNEASSFELSEHRDRKALEDYLFAMFSDVAGVSGVAPSSRPSPAPVLELEASIPFRDLVHAFGDGVLPPRSQLEVIATVKVGTQQLRFAAARVQGQTFRGLLAGANGKLWADRFELSEFPGVRSLVADVLKVDLGDVEVVDS